jgi:hypothetical protein
LGFRLSLRGAWLGAENENERAEIQAAPKKMYNLRSRAVHSGVVGQNPGNSETIKTGTALCKRLILKTMNADCRSECNKLALGEASAKA